MSDDKPFGLSDIGQIAITVRDLPRAVAFYRDVLCMQFLFEAPNLAFFSCGSVRLMLGPPESEELDHPSSIVYYRVDDIRVAHETLAQRGVQFIHEPLGFSIPGINDQDLTQYLHGTMIIPIIFFLLNLIHEE